MRLLHREVPETVKKAFETAAEARSATRAARDAAKEYWKVQTERELRLARIDAELAARRRGGRTR